MESSAEADAAVAALNGQDFLGKALVIEKVCPLFPQRERNTECLARPGEDVLEPPPPAGITVLPSATNVSAVMVSHFHPYLLSPCSILTYRSYHG
jgi:hypothetical protein